MEAKMGKYEGIAKPTFLYRGEKRLLNVKSKKKKKVKINMSSPCSICDIRKNKEDEVLCMKITFENGKKKKVYAFETMDQLTVF